MKWYENHKNVVSFFNNDDGASSLRKIEVEAFLLIKQGFNF